MTFKETFGFEPGETFTTNIEYAAIYVRLRAFAEAHKRCKDALYTLISEYPNFEQALPKKPLHKILEDIETERKLDSDRNVAYNEFMDALKLAREAGYTNLPAEIKDYYEQPAE